jgi:hypothetical protein
MIYNYTPPPCGATPSAVRAHLIRIGALKPRDQVAPRDHRVEGPCLTMTKSERVDAVANASNTEIDAFAMYAANESGPLKGFVWPPPKGQDR